ncbi:hypothetical protein GCM10025857_15960 [Alicyclobacillus contaminans]|uniref:transcriptional regulator n=1 Tax=Alicyclobacillus contaminans TaxID=392016 RepID=UPI0004253FEA|nr:transcriptional regulator [Alicyclobacillus contaminans]GMA50239.1 hypothetical protein GCM10025857_15960 [Alicyclobacillus contaminans]
MENAEKWVARSDAWTPEDDQRLASIVLNHIRSGSTQLRAFEEAGNELGRTAAACGYRWNGVLRKGLRAEIEAAKRDRKTAQKAVSPGLRRNPQIANPAASDSIQDVILFLQAYDLQYQKLKVQLENLQLENERLQSRIRELESTVAESGQIQLLELTPQQFEQDSKALFAIMERARKLLESDNEPRNE